MNKKTKKKLLRVLSVYLALNLLAEFVIPIPILALTGGPSQPEVESFEPVGTTEMVNLFTGDFNYNIPLMTVPGPNGGYPINLAYHAGIGMEQEAGWVGLGWNINPGVINRNMRGLPDDFMGDNVFKTLSYKPQQSVALDWSKFKIEPTLLVVINAATGDTSFVAEDAGLDRDKLGLSFTHQIHYNNYKGLGFGVHLSLTNIAAAHLSDNFATSLNISYDTDGGLGVSPSLSYSTITNKANRTYTIGLGFNSREGKHSLTLRTTKSKLASSKIEETSSYDFKQGKAGLEFFRTTNDVNMLYSSTGTSAGITFASAAPLPTKGTPTQSSMIRLGVTIGEPDATGFEFKKYQSRRFELSYTTSESTEIALAYQGYGLLYNGSETNASDQNIILDFNRENNAPGQRNSPAINSVYATSDGMFASGQGIGGNFSLKRSDIGVFHDGDITNKSPGGLVHVEFGKNIAAGALRLGGDYGINYSQSYSGDWKNGISSLNNLVFSNNVSTPLYEPAYYKSTGEMTASPIDEMTHIGNDDAVRFQLRSSMDNDLGILTVVENKLIRNETDLTPDDVNSNHKRTSRQKRTQHLSYRTSGAIQSTIGYGKPLISLYNINNFPSDNAPSLTAYSYGSRPQHHIGEVTVTNPDGTRYVYGLAAYNNSQKEVMFTKDGLMENQFPKTYAYTAGQDNSTDNSEGFDNLFMSTEIPGYAYSYLITAIYAADYVDLTGNGPTSDDFGYWVKFNYSKRQSCSGENEYGWRIPYRDASFSKGNISDLNDDKLSYMYGEKEVYYLNSIETKTHEAHFILNDNCSATERRADGYGAPQEDYLTGNGFGTDQRLNYLKGIELISKAEPSNIIKKVHFEYDYSLCANVANNSGDAVIQNTIDINDSHGKLTLKKIWFSHLGNEKGSLSPYTFTYDVGGPHDNPDYSVDHMDRWGNFMPDRNWGSGYPLNSNENPYVNQSAYSNNSNAYAAAWNLKKIGLPSGAEINIEYEADDYAYVQDQPAMQMQRIVGTGSTSNVTTDGEATPSGASLSDRNLILFFDLEETFNATSLTPTQRIAKIEPYVRDIDDLYFKTFLKLKKNPAHLPTTAYAYDYVEGYAEIDRTQTHSFGYGSPDANGIITTGWVRLKAMERNPWNPIGQTDHPIKLAGWQYMRLERNDLFDDGNLFGNDPDPLNMIQGFVNAINDVQRLFGYFNFCQANGYCNEINLADDGAEQIVDPRPSWIRLNTPDHKKIGGGHRVSTITITNNWATMSGETNPNNAIYGTSYQYTMPDGSSSGVAEYEPLIGGEENVMRKPLRYAARKFPYRNDGLFVEQPFAEGLYPAANVGYSRVIVKSINNTQDMNPALGQEVTINRIGQTVTEFYTAKDFPVLSDYTDLQKKNFAIPIIIPFIGEISYNNKGYSQGFSLEFNNMHGQMRSQAVYPANAQLNDPNTQPVSKVEYFYQTDPNGGPGGKPKLSNQVTVLTQDGVYETAEIGKTHEFYVDRQQHSNFSVSAGIQTNVGAVPPYLFWTNVFPYFEISKSLYRSISTMKIIQRNGVLSEVREYKDGAYSINKTLMYDAQTGQPLLTQTINNFNRPIYTYNYASHWSYDGMGPAYYNQGAQFHVNAISSGTFTFTNADQYFFPGDEIEFMRANGDIAIYWVTGVSGNTVSVIDESGTAVTDSGPASGTNLKILRSGRRNQQSSTNGVIVALKNPVTERKFPLFDAFNSYSPGEPAGNTLVANELYTDCVTGELVDINFQWFPLTNTLRIIKDQSECQANIVFPAGHDISTVTDCFDYNLFKQPDGTIKAVKGTTTLTCSWTAPNGCFQTCMDDVLHAEAYRFNDAWNFNYLAFGDPKYKVHGGSETPMASGFGNEYRFGTAGIWRMEESWLYQVDRKQFSLSSPFTRVPGDGTYKHFVLHDWSVNADHHTQNPQWTLSNTITMYDPHGFEVENKNALGIYSAALYGYGNSLTTAVGSNAKYGELAFNGFEEFNTTLPLGSAVGNTQFGSLQPITPIQLATTIAHTGQHSLWIKSSGGAFFNFTSDNTGATNIFNPIGGQKYHVSVWVKANYGTTPYLVVKNATTGVALETAATMNLSTPAIDGWRQINYTFIAPASTALTLELTATSATVTDCYFDDLRIQPYTSGMKTFVYYPNTLWLRAELDDRNYATYYNYDEEGRLVQVKKETEKGVVTINTARSNTKR